METKSNFWQRIGIQDWFLTDETKSSKQKATQLTPETIYSFIIDKFKASIQELSFADRIVFYHEFIITFNPEDYRAFVDNKQGIFGLIVQETVKKFYEILREYRQAGKTVEPSGSKWVFRLVSHPDYDRGDKGFIGKLLPGNNQKSENLRVTFIPRQTGIAQTFDINNDILKGFTYYSEGYMEIPYDTQLEYVDGNNAPSANQDVIARLEAIIPDKQYSGKKIEFLIKTEDTIVSGNEDEREDSNIFNIASEWTNSPHLHIRYNKTDGNFYLASFGELTTLNEVLVERSEMNSPQWVSLPLNSRMLLNGIIGLNLFKS